MKLHMTRKTFLAGLSAVAVTGWNRLFAECRPFGAGVRMPSGRIQRLLARALDHDVRPEPVAVEYDPADLNLPEPVRIGKRLKEYISAQPVTIRADEELVGWLSAVNWRLSRFARMRDDMKLAGDLEENNSALKRMLTAVENERMRTFMQMTPREGLHMALSRADFTVARRYAAAVLAYDEEDAEANFGMGMAELSLGRYAAAENYLKRCLVRRPEEPATLNNLSIICRKLGRYKESEDYARRALRRLPDSPEVKRTLADILAITEKNRRNQTPGAESADK